MKSVHVSESTLRRQRLASSIWNVSLEINYGAGKKLICSEVCQSRVECRIWDKFWENVVSLTQSSNHSKNSFESREIWLKRDAENSLSAGGLGEILARRLNLSKSGWRRKPEKGNCRFRDAWERFIFVWGGFWRLFRGNPENTWKELWKVHLGHSSTSWRRLSCETCLQMGILESFGSNICQPFSPSRDKRTFPNELRHAAIQCLLSTQSQLKFPPSTYRFCLFNSTSNPEISAKKKSLFSLRWAEWKLKAKKHVKHFHLTLSYKKSFIVKENFIEQFSVFIKSFSRLLLPSFHLTKKAFGYREQQLFQEFILHFIINSRWFLHSGKVFLHRLLLRSLRITWMETSSDTDTKGTESVARNYKGEEEKNHSNQIKKIFLLKSFQSFFCSTYI